MYDIRHDNVNYRTLQTLSTREADDYNKACSDCPYFDDFQTFVDYYGVTDFGNHWILAAASFDTTQFAGHGGNANFGGMPKIGVAEAMIMGILEMNVLLKIIQGVEQASAQCQTGCNNILCNEQAIHYLDQSVALYCGSIEGEEGTGEGVFQYALAQRRSIEFGVNDEGKTTNDRIMAFFQEVQDLLLQGNCETVSMRKRAILSLLKVPLVQSVLRFAYVRDHLQFLELDDAPKAEAFGATYAAAILPLVHKCHRADANVIYENLRIGSETSSVSFSRVKQALEENYECMGISCEDVGGIWTEDGFAQGAGPCGAGSFVSETTTNSSKNDAAFDILFYTCMMAMLVATALYYFLYYRKRHRNGRGLGNGIVRNSNPRGHHVRGTSGNIAAVTDIS